MSFPVLGLELGVETLAGTVLSPGRGQPILKALAVESCPPKGESAALASLLRRLAWRRGRVALAVPPGVCSLRRIHLPFTKTEEIRQVIEQEIADQFPWSLAELLWDYRIIRQNTHGSDLLIVVLQHDWLQGWLPLLQENGITAESLDFGSLALARQATHLTAGSSSSLLLDASCRHLTLASLREGEVDNLRELPWPSSWTRQVMSATKDDQARCLPDEAHKCLDEVAVLIRQTVSCWQLDDDRRPAPPTRMLLSGLLVALPELHAPLAQKLGMACECWLPADTVQEESPDEKPGLRPLLGRAIAVACSLCGSPAGVRLPLPRPRGLTRLQHGRGRLLVTLFAATLLGAAAIWALQLLRLQTSARHLDEDMTQLLRSTMPSIGRIVDPLQQMQTHVQSARSAAGSMPELANRRRVLDTLIALSRVLVQDPATNLSHFDMDRDSVQLRGVAASYRAVQTLRDQLAAHDGFADVAIVSASAAGRGSGGGRVVFQLKFRLRPSP